MSPTLDTPTRPAGDRWHDLRHAHALVRALARAAWIALRSARYDHTGHENDDPFDRFHDLFDQVQDAPAALTLFRTRVPEIEPTIHDVARGLVEFVPLALQLRGDHIFSAFSRRAALAAIERFRDEANDLGIEALAIPVTNSAPEYRVYYSRRDNGAPAGHL